MATEPGMALFTDTGAGGPMAGIDEAGRGPLAGPVVAAAVVLDPQSPVAGVTDSKKLTARARERLFDAIRSQAVAYAIAEASVAEIDRHNILQAALLAMQRAVDGLGGRAAHAVVDGNTCPRLGIPARARVKADLEVPCVGAASILAKVTRDRAMLGLHERYPAYGFDRHKGYPTRDHLARLAEHGPCPEHRRSFAPVRRALGETG